MQCNLQDKRKLPDLPTLRTSDQLPSKHQPQCCSMLDCNHSNILH